MTSVMVVDDETAVRRSMASILGGAGYDVQLARSGREAISKQKRSPANVILLDMKMPRLSGLDVAREIREFDPTVPFVAVTGFESDYRPRASSSDIFDWISKPVMSAGRKKRLLASVGRAVSESHARTLSTDMSEIVRRLDEGDVSKLIDSVERLNELLSRPGIRFGNEATHWRDVAKLSLLLSSAGLIGRSRVALDVFSRVFFSEIGSSVGLQKSLQAIRISRMADSYEEDMVALIGIALKPEV